MKILFCLWLCLALAGNAQSPLPVVNDELLTPEEAVELALRHSPDPALARLQTRIREAERDVAASASRPKIGLGAFASAQNVPMIYSTGTDPTFLQVLPPPNALNLNAMLMWPLYTGGLLEHRLAAAEKAQRSAEALQDLTILETVRDVRMAYFGLTQELAQKDVLGWELEAREELLRVAHERFRVGRVARFVVVRAEADVAETRQRRNELSAALQEKEARLKSLLGISLSSQLAYPRQFPLPPAPPSLEESLNLAYGRRPDRVAARFAIEEADELLLAALADFSPKFYAVGMLEGMKVDMFGSGPLNGGYSVGLVVNFPLYDGGLREAESDRSQAELDTRKLRLQKLDLEIQQQVASAHGRYLSSLANVELAQVEVDKASEEHRVSRLRFSVGRGIYLEVLDSVTALRRAKSNQVRALYQAHIHSAELLYASGSLDR